jgi:hypothetical protein
MTKEELIHFLDWCDTKDTSELKWDEVAINYLQEFPNLSTPPDTAESPSEEEIQKHINHELKDDLNEDFENGYDCGFHDAIEWLQSRMKKEGWVSVSDRLPDVKQKILILTDYGGMDICHFASPDNFINDLRPQHSNGGVTHWRELPPPPDETTKTEWIPPKGSPSDMDAAT